MSVEILKQGAEGRLYLGTYKGEQCLIKERFVKKYRHPELDAQITRQRMKAEAKAAARCETAGILVPRILHTDHNEHKIYMEYLADAKTVKEFIQNDINSDASKLELLCSRIGNIIGKMHSNNIIHGDLTTSNMLVRPKTDVEGDYNVVFIDFGLSHYSQTTEDKGVDLYVLERALLSTHSECPQLFELILKAYRQTCGKDEQAVVAKFEEVRARGRKRTMIG